ncbi:MAG: hypothetical protein ABIZ81_06845 [Opitutaceae bacterium]
MKTDRSAEPPDGAEPAQVDVEKVPPIAQLAKFIDAASALGFTAASLYFWGYSYYSQFCERLGVSFQGISLPTEDYLIVSWLTVTLLLLLIGAGLIMIYLVRDTADNLAALLRRHGVGKSANTKPGAHVPFLSGGLAILCLSGILLAGSKFMAVQANDAADQALARRTEVVIRNPEGNVIEGRFIYLRDFGSALLVGELDADGRELAAHRILKASSFGGYSLLARKPPGVEASKK